jgi:hypothetical protein
MEAFLMKVVDKLAVAAVLFSFYFGNCSGASADNWRDDNPNQPNGYAASMYRYHHGTPDDDGVHDGYAASSFRERNGLDGFLPPDKSDDDGWGGGDRGGSRWGGGGSGGGFGSGSGLGRHFRQGQAEGEAFWKNRLQSQMQGGQMAQMGQVGRMGQIGRMQQMGAGEQMNQGGQMSQMARVNEMRQMMGNRYGSSPGAQNYGGGAGRMSGYAGEQPHFNQSYENQSMPASCNYQYAPNSFNNAGYGNSAALRSAVSQRPIGTLLRNSQGGFNRIYTGE